MRRYLFTFQTQMLFIWLEFTLSCHDVYIASFSLDIAVGVGVRISIVVLVIIDWASTYIVSRVTTCTCSCIDASIVTWTSSGIVGWWGWNVDAGGCTCIAVTTWRGIALMTRVTSIARWLMNLISGRRTCTRPNNIWSWRVRRTIVVLVIWSGWWVVWAAWVIYRKR